MTADTPSDHAIAAHCQGPQVHGLAIDHGGRAPSALTRRPSPCCSRTAATGRAAGPVRCIMGRGERPLVHARGRPAAVPGHGHATDEQLRTRLQPAVPARSARQPRKDLPPPEILLPRPACTTCGTCTPPRSWLARRYTWRRTGSGTPTRQSPFGSTPTSSTRAHSAPRRPSPMPSPVSRTTITQTGMGDGTMALDRPAPNCRPDRLQECSQTADQGLHPGPKLGQTGR